MKDDVSAIPVNGCNVLADYGVVVNYNGSVKKEFINNGGKWYLFKTESSVYGDYNIAPYNCINVSDLNTNAVFEPFLYFISFCLVICVILLLKWVWGGLFRVN